MAETFPVNLAQCFIIDGFTFQNVPNTIRSEVEVGIPKVRRRYTKAYGQASAAMVVDKAGVKTFQDFFNIALKSGVYRFLFTDPITETEKEYRFLETPIISSLGANHWKITMLLEVLT